jgi:hypothetical protein
MDPIVVRPMAKGFILAKDLVDFYLFLISFSHDTKQVSQEKIKIKTGFP